MIVFRSDASNVIGTGHIMRCLRLAKKLKNLGKKCFFICSDHKGNLIEKIQREGFEVRIIKKRRKIYSKKINTNKLQHFDWLGSSMEDDAKQTIKIFEKRKIELLIIDHYAIDKSWEMKLRPFTKKIMVIDDLADRHHACDLLLDQNLVYNFKKRYKNLLPQKTNLLLGPRFALLDPHYSKLHKKTLIKSGKIKRVIIFFGGADQENLTGLSTHIFTKFNKNEILFDVIVSKKNIFYSQIMKLSQKNKNITLHNELPSLAPLIYKADLAIGAAGSNTWERCCLGTPSIIIISGTNQKKIAQAMKEAGVAIVLEQNLNLKKEIEKAFILLSTNKRLYLKMSKKAFSICDGEGINRVIKKLL